MPPHVIVSFDPQTEFHFPLEANALASAASEGGRRWFEREYATLGIEPGSPLGKVLVIDKILDVARHGGVRRFTDDPAWGQRFALNTVLALGRQTVRVDVAADAIDYCGQPAQDVENA